MYAYFLAFYTDMEEEKYFYQSIWQQFQVHLTTK